MRKLRWLLVVLAAVGLLTLAGCGTSSGSDAGSSGSSEGGEATTTVAADDGFVSGTPQEWLADVCGADAEIAKSDSDLEPRYGPDATESYYCPSITQDDGTDTYPEAVLFSSDPSADWQPSTEPDTYLTFAIGQVSDDEWALVYEDSSTDEIADPHLSGLTEFGFEVYENNEPVG